MKMFDAGKTRMIGLPYGEKAMTMLSRSSDTGMLQTDRQIDRFAISISRVSMLTRSHSRSLKMAPFESLGKVCYSHSIVTGCILYRVFVSDIQWDIGRKW